MPVSLFERKEMETEDEKDEVLENAASSETAEETFSSELNQPCWSVVTYKSVAVSHLTYDEANQWASDLEKQGISGLCIVTDAAANKILY